MSYRTIKRLFGETSLERKCRLLLGGGFLVLILLGFFLSAWKTENLVWEQNVRTGKLLINRVIRERHLQALADANRGAGKDSNMALELNKFLSQESLSKQGVTDDNYVSRLLRPNLPPDKRPIEYSATSDHSAEMARKLYENELPELRDFDENPGEFTYLRSIRLDASCLQCHPTALDKKLGIKSYKPGDFLTAVQVSFPLADTELIINVNRAILLSFAIGTALLAMLFAYIIVRYVIVKPVSHLKQVSDEIAAGNVAIRAEINTGDEFQELSQAFNRMLRTLVQMQDELRRVNADLDEKLDDIAKANMSLFEMNRLKSEFLATISHELRTPLNSILGFSDLLAAGDASGDKNKRWVQNIQTSGKVLLGLINDILDLAKLEAGKMQVNIEEFSLRDAIESQLAMMRPLADQKNIALVADVDHSLPILKQDSKKISQILNNLLSNAIKFTPEGGQVTATARQDRAHFLLSVRDNGIGIAAEDQRLIFDKFRQTGNTLTRQHSGTGLGLSIVRELTKLLGGDEVQLESQLGRGSTFTIRLPIQLVEQSSEELSLGRTPLPATPDPRRSEIRYFGPRDGQGPGSVNTAPRTAERP